MRIMNERQISACECIYRLCHLNFRQSSRKCIFLNTRLPEQRYRVLKFDQNNQATGFLTNILERYQKRPINHAEYDFENMNFMEFAMLFEAHYTKPPNYEEENIDEDVYQQQPQNRKRLITLMDNSKVSVRNKPAVVRVPFLNAQADPANYYYSLLLQYMPFREESEILRGFNSSKAAFVAREEQLNHQCSKMEIHRKRDKQLEVAFNQVHAFELIHNPEVIHDEDEVIEENDIPMNDSHFESGCRAMNLEQRELFNVVTADVEKQLNGENKRLNLFITGGAGTGKTFLFNLLRNQINRCYGKKKSVKICALTGVAARLVGGSTLHSTLKLPVQKDGRIVNMADLSGNYLCTMRLEWKDIQFFFVDEISMVPYEMLCQINRRLQELKNEPNKLFGGINVLFFGDLMQLPPVRGHQIFQQPQQLSGATHLWRLFNLVELKQNMRQQGDTTFIDLLNALRVGEMKPEHFKVLLKKVGNFAKLGPDSSFAIDKALRIFPTNNQVDAHNQLVLEYFRNNGTEMFKIKSQDMLVDATRNMDKVTLDSIIHKDINKTGGFPKELEIFVGTKVMLRSNIDVPKGLVNGAIGVITQIVWPSFRRAQMYESDIPSVYVNFGLNGIHLIQPRSVQFPAKWSYGTAERRMLPLILAFASTVHKMQGSTVDYAVVHLGRSLFAEGQAYVTLSRLRSLDGLMIEELDCAKLSGKKPCNNNALREIFRMRNINVNT